MGSLKCFTCLYILVAVAGHSYAGNCYARWMERAMNLTASNYAHSIQQFRLNNITLPGTHNAASSKLYPSVLSDDPKLEPMWNQSVKLLGERTAFSQFFAWSQCQACSVHDQLMLGVRYLDIRVGFNGTQFVTHHGLTGRPTADVALEIVSFADQFPSELILVEFGQFLNFSSWDMFVSWRNETLSIFGSRLQQGPLNSSSTIADVVRTGQTIIAVLSGPIIADRNESEIFPFVHRTSVAMSTWANTDDVGEFERRLQGLLDSFNTSSSLLFSLGWTMTASSTTIGRGVVAGQYPQSLRDLAQLVGPRLPEFLERNQNKTINVISVDFVEDSLTIDLAIGMTVCRDLNCMQHPETRELLLHESSDCPAKPVCSPPLVQSAAINSQPPQLLPLNISSSVNHASETGWKIWAALTVAALCTSTNL